MKIKIVPDVYFIIFLGLSFLFHYYCPLVKLISYPYSLGGFSLVLTGLIIAFKINFILLKNSTSVKAFEPATVLITSGPFRYSRNPVYLGMVIILFGVEIILGSLSPFICPLLLFIILNIFIITKEETELEKLFGEQYLNYKTKVRRWI